mmetsp:Transcript_73244/g.201133  ORF Transcript_73244/g.201133 Transcript_73244/m.201133 type:complete len:219 (-) Transcript_73244:858-1514(-)
MILLAEMAGLQRLLYRPEAPQSTGRRALRALQPTVAVTCPDWGACTRAVAPMDRAITSISSSQSAAFGSGWRLSARRVVPRSGGSPSSSARGRWRRNGTPSQAWTFWAAASAMASTASTRAAASTLTRRCRPAGASRCAPAAPGEQAWARRAKACRATPTGAPPLPRDGTAPTRAAPTWMHGSDANSGGRVSVEASRWWRAWTVVCRVIPRVGRVARV